MCPFILVRMATTPVAIAAGITSAVIIIIVIIGSSIYLLLFRQDTDNG